MEETREMTKLYRPTKGQSWQLLSKRKYLLFLWILCPWPLGDLTARWILRTVKALPIEGFHVARLLWILASLLLKTGDFQFSHCLRITPFSTLSIPINLMSVYWVLHRKYVTPTHRLSLPRSPLICFTGTLDWRDWGSVATIPMVRKQLDYPPKPIRSIGPQLAFLRVKDKKVLVTTFGKKKKIDRAWHKNQGIVNKKNKLSLLYRFR